MKDFYFCQSAYLPVLKILQRSCLTYITGKCSECSHHEEVTCESSCIEILGESTDSCPVEWRCPQVGGSQLWNEGRCENEDNKCALLFRDSALEREKADWVVTRERCKVERGFDCLNGSVFSRESYNGNFPGERQRLNIQWKGVKNIILFLIR